MNNRVGGLKLMRNEGGVSLAGLLAILVLVVLGVVLVVKVLPVYYDYWSLENILKTQAKEANPQDSDERIRYDLRRRLDVAMLQIPDEDIAISRPSPGQVQIAVDYDSVVPLVANVSLRFHFHAKATGP